METTTTETPTTETPAERFVIDTEQKAAWVLRKFRLISEERAAIKAATAERLEQLDADEARLNARFSDELRTWGEAEKERRRRKTITVPLAGASLAFRTVGAHIEIEDKDTAAEVAVSLGYTKPAAADLTAYKKAAAEALETRGELLPGLTLAPEREAFSIKFIGDKTEVPTSGEEATKE